MARADEYLALLDDPNAPAPSGQHPADPALLSLLVHMACADGLVQEEEFSYFEKLLPGLDAGEVLEWVAETAAQDLDFTAVAACLHDDEERRGALRFAARMAWADRVLDMQEKLLLIRLAGQFDFPEDEVEIVLDEVVGHPTGNIPPEAIREAMEGMAWKAVQPEETGLFSELKSVVPPEARPVARLLVDGQERAGLYDLGMAANFEEGPQFLAWNDVSTYTRVPVLGAALRVMTVDGRTLTVRDPRLREVGTLLDRVYSSGDE